MRNSECRMPALRTSLLLNAESCILQYKAMPQSHRPDRVGEEIRHELSELIRRRGVHDPGIGFITLPRVKVTPDLQQARVFYTTLGDDAARRETSKALQRATPFFRRHIGSQLRLRRVP